MILTILIFIVILGILVFVHEFGHFIVAKKSGMVVEEFGFGFPPRLAGIQKIDGKWRWVWVRRKSVVDPSAPVNQQLTDPGSNTIYSINAIPLGGFVRILGENNESQDHPGSFINKGFWPRLLTLVAGVCMNWLLAAVIFSVVAAIGVNSEITPDLPANAVISNRQVAIADVLPNSPAANAGLLSQDLIVNIDGKRFETSEQAKNYIIFNQGKEFKFEIKRINDIKDFTIQSLAHPGPDQGPTGIEITDIATVRLPWGSAIAQGFSEAYQLIGQIFYQLGSLFHSRQALSQVGGPVAIGKLVGQVRQLGIVPLLRLIAFLSLSLAALNILPFPALDGGRVLFLLIEKIRRKRNNQKVEQIVNTAGFIFLILLMVVVTINDVIKK